jgi:hypothetical protein
MPHSGGTRRQAEFALRMVTRPAPFRKPAAEGTPVAKPPF